MVIIHFQTGIEWFKANWVFRQLAEDIFERLPEDKQLRFEMEKAEALGALYLDSLEVASAAKVLEAIRLVAQATIKGDIQGWKQRTSGEDNSRRLYLEAISELLQNVEDSSGDAASGIGCLCP